MIEAGGNMNDREGWVPVTCMVSDEIRQDAEGVSSSLTDPDGIYGPAVRYTEWHSEGFPVLRDYLWFDNTRPCEHLVPGSPS